MVEPALSAPDDDAVALIEAVHEAVAAAEAGHLVPYEAVRRWLLSWGTEAELSPPPCP